MNLHRTQALAATALLVSALLLSGCVSEVRPQSDVAEDGEWAAISDSSPPGELEEGEGYLALIFDTVDPVGNVTIRDKSSKFSSFKFRNIVKGRSIRVAKLRAGPYCINRLSVYGKRFEYYDEGICFEVEAGGINYPASIFIRWPKTEMVREFRAYVTMMENEYPVLFDKYIQ